MDERWLFYASPMDVGDGQAWQGFADRIRRDIVLACGRRTSIQIGEQPIFAPGMDGEDAILDFQEWHMEWQHVRVEPWCAYPGYACICVLLGPGFVRKNLRNLKSRLRKLNRHMTLLHEHEGDYRRDCGRAYAYNLSTSDARDLATLEFIMEAYADGALYFGERWMLQGGDEAIDESNFSILQESPDMAVFEVHDEDAEEELWKNSTAGLGLMAFSHRDPVGKHLLARFKDKDDLRVLCAESDHFSMRVALNRTLEAPVVVYDPQVGPPEIDDPILFMF